MIKLFHSNMVGAPTLSNVAGNLITVLDACLVNGWGSATVDSIVITSDIATVTLAGHPFEADTVSLIAGATVSGGSINGEQKVLTVTATTYTFDATGISNQTATGTITHVLPSLGFEKVYSGTNLAAYRSPTGIRHYLRIDDTVTTAGRGIAYESMGGITTDLVGPYPTTAQISGGSYWYKSSSGVKTWTIIGDNKGFYFRPQPGSLAVYDIGTCYFGEFTSTKSVDNYASWLFAPATVGTSSLSNNTFADISYMQTGTANTTGWISRPWYGVGGSISAIRSFNSIIYNGFATSRYSGEYSTTAFMSTPNLSNGSLYVSPMHIGEAGGIYRGDLPGFYASPHSFGNNAFTLGQRITGVTGLTNRSLMAMPTGMGVYFIDLTGPWR